MAKSNTKSVWLTMFYLLCLVSSVMFVGYHLYKLISSDIVTFRAEGKHFEESAVYTGYIARDEENIPLPSGSLLFTGENGIKLKTGDVCAYEYSGDKEEILSEMARLEEEGTLLSSALYYATLSQSEADASLYYERLMQSLADGRTNVEEYSDRLLSALFSQEYVFDRSSIRKAYEKNRTTLEALRVSLGAEISKIYMPHTGYFFKESDGLSHLLPASLGDGASAETIIEAIESYNSAEPKEGRFAAAVKDTEWYIITVTSTEDGARYAKGKNYSLYLDESDLSVSGYLKDIKTTADGSAVSLVFSLSVIPEDFDFSRSFSLKISANEYNAYRIPYSALRTLDDGTRGVYILSGGVVLFRRVELISVNSSYVLAKTYKEYTEDLLESKNASGIYNSVKADSLFTGIYPGESLFELESTEKILNGSLRIEDKDGDMSINLEAANEKFEYSYLEENEFVIIKGSGLYHGKTPG